MVVFHISRVSSPTFQTSSKGDFDLASRGFFQRREWVMGLPPPPLNLQFNINDPKISLFNFMAVVTMEK